MDWKGQVHHEHKEQQGSPQLDSPVSAVTVSVDDGERNFAPSGKLYDCRVDSIFFGELFSDFEIVLLFQCRFQSLCHPAGKLLSPLPPGPSLSST